MSDAAVTPESLREALRPLQDPELRLGLVDLGLIYDFVLEREGREVTVRMTLTSPGCPFGPLLMSAVHEIVARQPGVEKVEVQLVWDPPWNPALMASDEAKDRLGIW